MKNLSTEQMIFILAIFFPTLIAGMISLDMIINTTQSESYQAIQLCNGLQVANRDACYAAIIELGFTTDE